MSRQITKFIQSSKTFSLEQNELSEWPGIASARVALLETETDVVWLTVAVAVADAVVALVLFEIAADGAVAVAAAAAVALVLLLATILTSVLGALLEVA